MIFKYNELRTICINKILGKDLNGIHNNLFEQFGIFSVGLRNRTE